MKDEPSRSSRINSRNTGYMMAGIAVFMLFFSFASVPLYRIFCQETGFGGTPKIVPFLKASLTNRFIRVHFNTDIQRHLPWQFKPMQQEMRVRIGEPSVAFFKVKNLSNRPIIGIASYNVTPDKVAPYFYKVKCFCFEEQRLEAGEEVEMGVQFYLHHDMLKDRQVDDVKVLTLSYTFFEAKNFKWPF